MSDDMELMRRMGKLPGEFMNDYERMQRHTKPGGCIYGIVAGCVEIISAQAMPLEALYHRRIGHHYFNCVKFLVAIGVLTWFSYLEMRYLDRWLDWQFRGDEGIWYGVFPFLFPVWGLVFFVSFIVTRISTYEWNHAARRQGDIDLLVHSESPGSVAFCWPRWKIHDFLVLLGIEPVGTSVSGLLIAYLDPYFGFYLFVLGGLLLIKNSFGVIGMLRAERRQRDNQAQTANQRRGADQTSKARPMRCVVVSIPEPGQEPERPNAIVHSQTNSS